MTSSSTAPAPRFDRLDDWLRWQEKLHPREIDLGLERIAGVLARMGGVLAGIPVITIGGTNGKGSCVAMLEAIYQAAGYRTGAYTSPHLLRYNERIRVAGEAVEDALICDAFAAVDAARGEVSLSYFEFGTLAALHVFEQAGVDVVLLEVGLGGRLDAVNVIDPDVALVVSVGLDHLDWLGPDRESIGYEKAGIYRGGRPAVCGDMQPPASLCRHARDIGAQLHLAGADYQWRQVSPESWCWQGRDAAWENLPLPRMAGAVQLGNAAAVLQVVQCAGQRLPVSREALIAGFSGALLPGRCEYQAAPVSRVLDVAHNAESARALVQALQVLPVSGVRRTVLGMLRDKPVQAVIEALAPHTDQWYLATLPPPRGQSSTELEKTLQRIRPDALWQTFDDADMAVRQAQTEARHGDQIVFTGSFLTVAAAMAQDEQRGA